MISHCVAKEGGFVACSAICLLYSCICTREDEGVGVKIYEEGLPLLRVLESGLPPLGGSAAPPNTLVSLLMKVLFPQLDLLLVFQPLVV